MKDSEYGGADTLKTKGIQPAPHEPDAGEQLRILYDTDPSDELSVPSAVTA